MILVEMDNSSTRSERASSETFWIPVIHFYPLEMLHPKIHSIELWAISTEMHATGEMANIWSEEANVETFYCYKMGFR